MDKIAIILAILEKLLRYGPDYVVEIAKLFETGTPTVEEIEALEITKKPEDYYNGT